MSLRDEIERRTGELQGSPETTLQADLLAVLRATRIQLSRWRIERPRRWRAPVVEDVVFVELAGAGGQRTFVAPVAPDAASRLDGLPWLDQQPAEPLDSLDSLIELACAARRRGAELVRWDPDAIGAAPPIHGPRHIPLKTLFGICLGHGSAEGMMATVAGVLFIAAIVAPFTDLRDATLSPDIQVRAEVVDVTPTGSPEVRRYDVRYLDHQGQLRYSAFEARGLTAGVGEELGVEYDARSPADARLEGGRFGRTAWGFWATLMAMAALAALALALVILRRLRLVGLLRHGRVALATPVSKMRSNSVDFAHTPRYRLELAYTAHDGSMHHHEMETDSGDELARESPREILYPPARPGQGRLLTELPDRLRIEDDQVVAKRPYDVRFFVIVTAASLVLGALNLALVLLLPR